jgi:hypothetical protein
MRTSPFIFDLIGGNGNTLKFTTTSKLNSPETHCKRMPLPDPFVDYYKLPLSTVNMLNDHAFNEPRCREALEGLKYALDK